MKYGNISANYGHKSFQSQLERDRYAELVLLEKAGEIRDLETQKEFRLVVNGDLICRYRADFVYWNMNGRYIVEDTKSTATVTDAYRIKKKLMRALHGIDIQEVYRGQVSRLSTGRKLRRA